VEPEDEPPARVELGRQREAEQPGERLRQRQAETRVEGVGAGGILSPETLEEKRHWQLTDRNSGARGAIDDYLALGGHLGIGFRF
jgi:hypothetical protein